ncbi:cytochrome C [Marinobacter sp.]|uniref:cytochrome C n=1 Tax=Marinobacter sp. TaxID=50741 RepID=UPI003BA97287
MKSFTRIVSLSLILASPFGEARVIPDTTQKPAPGNAAQQTPLSQANYSPAVNYQLQCLGCHLTNGEGAPRNDIPRMTDFVGNFLKVEGGREFLVQVPGSSQSALNDQQLADLLNWMLKNDGIAGGSSPEGFKPYSSAEVSAYRKEGIQDLPSVRRHLLEQMKKMGITIPEAVMP